MEREREREREPQVVEECQLTYGRAFLSVRYLHSLVVVDIRMVPDLGKSNEIFLTHAHTHTHTHTHTLQERERGGRGRSRDLGTNGKGLERTGSGGGASLLQTVHVEVIESSLYWGGSD